MGPAVGLQVEADDVDGPDFLDGRRQEVDLGADKVRYLEGFFAGEGFDLYRMRRGDLGVDAGLDFTGEVRGHLVELEVHARR